MVAGGLEEIAYTTLTTPSTSLVILVEIFSRSWWEARYQSAEAIAEDLRRFLADEPIRARRRFPESDGGRTTRSLLLNGPPMRRGAEL